jgi:hypothetical protein
MPREIRKKLYDERKIENISEVIDKLEMILE